jgi:hypothetical protein
MGLIVLLWAMSGPAVTLDSCSAIRTYLRQPLPADLYTVTEDLRTAAEFLGIHPNICPLYDVERVRWTYADALDRFSRTFAADPEATRTWAGKAALQYENYLEWFLSLTPADQSTLIVSVTGKSSTLPEFDAIEQRWLRSRVGNVLNSLGGVLEFTRSYDELVEYYGSFSSACISAGSSCVRVIPVEMVEKWFKWLRVMPDFSSAPKSDSKLSQLIHDRDDCSQAWSAFKSFLDTYVPANPSVRDTWDVRRKRIRTWFES